MKTGREHIWLVVGHLGTLALLVKMIKKEVAKEVVVVEVVEKEEAVGVEAVEEDNPKDK